MRLAAIVRTMTAIAVFVPSVVLKRSVPAIAADAVVNATPLVAIRANEPISIDGKLTESCWADADALDDFKLFRGNSRAAIPTTEVRLLQDDANLYVAFKCADQDICSYSAVDDDPLYEGDVVEVFIRPDTSKATYYEFIVAPSGAMYDARNLERGPKIGGEYKYWNSAARRAATVCGTEGDADDKDKGYTVEMAIPWTAFDVATRSDNADWRIGLFRCDISRHMDNPLLLMSISKASDFGFHTYEQYHPLIFKD
jgi:hypothetical protein